MRRWRIVRGDRGGYRELYLHGRFGRFKALELGVQLKGRDLANLLSASAECALRLRGHHPGWRSHVFLGRLFVEFNVYDQRHWDYEKGRIEDS